jgi:hypothetical protein
VANGDVVAIASQATRQVESAQETVATLVERLRARRDELAHAIQAHIDETVPDPVGSMDPDYRQGMRLAIVELLDYIFEGLTHGPEWSRAMPEAALVQARRAARAGVGVGTVLRRYLAGHGRLAELITETSDSGGYAGSEPALRHMRARQAALVEQLSAKIEREYERERRRLTSVPEQRRWETVRRLLAGETVDPVDTAALAYQLDGHWHVGLVVNGDHAEEAMQALKLQLGRRLLWARFEPGVVWAWLGGQRKPATREIEQLATAGHKIPQTVAIGEPGKGLEGWRLTHRQAREALALASRTPERLARYGDAPLLVAALNNDTLAQSLTVFLSRLDYCGNGTKLRRTLRAYLGLQCNASSTAAFLKMGRHTTETHVRSAEDLLGHTLNSCLPTLHTALALDALDQDVAGDSPSIL